METVVCLQFCGRTRIRAQLRTDVGEIGVGKTSLLVRFDEDKFSPNFITTIGYDETHVHKELSMALDQRCVAERLEKSVFDFFGALGHAC